MEDIWFFFPSPEDSWAEPNKLLWEFFFFCLIFTLWRSALGCLCFSRCGIIKGLSWTCWIVWCCFWVRTHLQNLAERSDHQDPADTHCALSSQGTLLGQHDQLLRTVLEKLPVMTQMVSELTQQVSKLTGSAYPLAAAASVGVRDSYACDPQLFEGDLVKWRGFLLQW